MSQFRDHPGLRGLAGLRWCLAARIGLVALLLRDAPCNTAWKPPATPPPASLARVLRAALSGEVVPAEGPPLPLAAVRTNADTVDDRLLTLLAILGADAVAADPGLPLRLSHQLPRLPPLSKVQRKVLGLRLCLGSAGHAQGAGPGIDRVGIDTRGNLAAVLPSQYALPPAVFTFRKHEGTLLFRARSAEEAPRLRPVVLVLDVSPPVFGPIEKVTRPAAHAVAASLIDARVPVVLATAGGRCILRVLETPADLVELWMARSLEPADVGRTLNAARSLARQMHDGPLEPVILLLTHPWFGAEAGDIPHLTGLRGLFVQYPRRNARPALADLCERFETVSSKSAPHLSELLGWLVG